jgi:murein DD-endopeptidase MepM/ murein hydrolase activator NlpD
MSKPRGMLSLAAAPLVLVIAMLLYVGIAAEEEARACTPGGTSDVVAIAVNPSAVPQGPVAGYRHEQLVNAAHILNAAAELRLTRRDQQIGVMTAMGESGLRVLDHGDEAGPDSRGLFQQRSGGAWGSLADRMDPHISATNFFTALAAVPGRDALEPTLVANRVQRNADPYHYRPYWGPAGDVVDALTPGGAPAANVNTAGSTDPTGYNLGPVQPQLTELVAVLGPMFNITRVGGYRASATDPNGHPAGLAADFMVPLNAAGRAQGTALATYAMTNAATLKVDYILWQQRIWSAARASEGWRPMADRGSASQNHLDHVHINVIPTGAATPTTSNVTSQTEFPYCLTSATAGEWVVPLDAPISSPFGVRVHPITGQPSFHDGVDYATSCGTSVAAASSGTVIKAGRDSIYGHQIVIDHGRVAEGQLRIGTLNWRGASHFTKNPYPGERHFSVRVPNMINKIAESGTSIVGFQEFEQPQADAFLAGTRGTWKIVTGRRRGAANPADAIAYQPDLWTVDQIRYVTIRYGGALIQLPLVRFTATSGSAGSVWVLNAHNPANSIGGTDAMRDAAVRAEVQALRQVQTSDPSTPLFLVGDMNDRARFRQVFLGQAGPGWSSANPSDEQVDWVMGGPGVTFTDAVVDRTTNDRARSYTDHPFVHASATLPGSTATTSTIQTKYGHMEASGVLVRVGDQVATGQVIAKVGDAGLSTGCHLHFTVEVDGEPTDPVAFLADRIPDAVSRRVHAVSAASGLTS